MAHGILAPQPGIEPTSPPLRQILNHWTTREVPQIYTGVKLLGQKLSELSALQDNPKLLIKVVFTNLQFQQHCIGDLLVPNPLQHLVLSDVLIFISQIDIKQNFTVVSICFSLINSDVEHLSMFLLAIFMSLGKCLFRSSSHFLPGSGFLILSYMNSLYVNLIRYIICKQVILFSMLPFHSVDGFPHRAKISSHLFIFVIVFLAWRESFKKILLRPMSKIVQPMFSSRSFILQFQILYLCLQSIFGLFL